MMNANVNIFFDSPGFRRALNSACLLSAKTPADVEDVARQLIPVFMTVGKKKDDINEDEK
jgi:hypothetical protein